MTTVHGNQTLVKTTANALRVLDLARRSDIPVAAGADRPLVRELTARRTSTARAGSTVLRYRRRYAMPWARTRSIHGGANRGERRARDARAVGPLTNVALLADATGCEKSSASSHGRLDRRRQHDAVGRVQHLGRSRGADGVFRAGVDVTMIGLDVTHRAERPGCRTDAGGGPRSGLRCRLVDFSRSTISRRTAGTAHHPRRGGGRTGRTARARDDRRSQRRNRARRYSRCGRTVVDLWRRTERPVECPCRCRPRHRRLISTLLVERIGALG